MSGRIPLKSDVAESSRTMSVNANAAVLLSLFVVTSCLFTLGQLVMFLSSHKPLQLNPEHTGYFEHVSLQVAVDFFLVALFVLQHSLQCSKGVKDFLSLRGADPFERLFYNLGSCLALQVLMRFWQPVPGWVVWEASNNVTLWWLFTIVHGIAWLLIYSGCYVMDLTEMLGVKQVIYAFQNNPAPLSLKSEGLRRFYAHMRHPGFCALTVILFFHPVMQLDRLLLAYGLTIYTLLRTEVDDVDYAYQLRLMQRKKRDLNYNE